MFELICLILSMLVYVLYISIVCLKYKVPDCLSRTYYLIKNKDVFTYWMISLSLLMFPAWVAISGITYQFITFISVVSLIGVGIMPRYLQDQKLGHILCACIAAILSVIWSILSGVYFMVLILAVTTSVLCFFYPKYYLFILENVAFMNIYLSALWKILILL